MKHFFTSAVLSAGLLFGAVSASASSLPAVDGNYEGSYRLADVFTPDTHRSFTHGLYLPGFLGEESWTIESGRAEYDGTELSLKGKVKQTTGGSDYFLNFDFSVFKTSDEPTNPYCGSSTCSNATQQMKDNVQYFDMGNNPTMGQITGEGALSSVVIDVVMRPLNFPNDYKPGQLGYGANWWDQEFGYSNWFKYSVLSNTSGVGRTSSDWKGGDINVNLVPTPLPAGLPLVLTAFGGLYVLRRRQKAA